MIAILCDSVSICLCISALRRLGLFERAKSLESKRRGHYCVSKRYIDTILEGNETVELKSL